MKPKADGVPSSPKLVVLVVEDEPVMRMMAVDMIEDAGFEVVEAADATEAVRVLERRLDIRVVFTDVDMPRGIDGMKLGALIRDRWPPIQIILTSGDMSLDESVILANSVFFSKPYRAEQVIAAIRRMTTT